jgi:ribonuclease HI
MVTQAAGPHFLLYSDASGTACGLPRWKFVLQSVGCDDQFAAGDVEPETPIARLELLSVVRGLEAIDQPSRVTLVTTSRYVARGIRRELSHWRERSWHWERFGKLVPIRDRDLWQRVDRALSIHQVECIRRPACRNAFPRPEDNQLSETAATPLEPALLIVPRSAVRPARETIVARALNKLYEGILAPFSAILRPAFTRAA